MHWHSNSISSKVSRFTYASPTVHVSPLVVHALQIFALELKVSQLTESWHYLNDLTTDDATEGFVARVIISK